MTSDTALVTAGLGLVVALGAQHVARRMLRAPVGAVRSFSVGLVFVVVAVPVVDAALEPTGVIDASGTLAVDVGVLGLVVALALGWAFVAVLTALVVLELVLPAGTVPNPASAVLALVAWTRRVVRYLEVTAIVGVHAVGALRRERPGAGTSRAACALVGALNTAGVTFVKFGQVLSTRTGALPPAFTTPLASLQSDADPVGPERVRKILAAELGHRLEEIDMDDEPIAAASVAQVHRGTIIATGERVVLKIRRPDALRTVRVDVDIIRRVSRRLESTTAWAREMRITALADGFADSLLDEVDFRVEADNTRRIAGLGGPVHVPRVHEAYPSRRVLVLEYIDGVTLGCAETELAQLDDATRADLAKTLLRTVLGQVLLDGVFHADIHPGNVVLRSDRSLALIDLGSVGVLDTQLREVLLALLVAFDSQDNETAATLLTQLAPSADIDGYALRRDLGRAMSTISGVDGFGPTGTAELFRIFRRHRLALPPAVAAAIRTFGSMQRCIDLLAPSVDLVALLRECLREILDEAFCGDRVSQALRSRAVAAAYLSERVPGLLSSLADQVVDGRLAVARTIGSDLGAWSSRILGDALCTVVAGILIVASVLLLSAPTSLLLTETVPWTYYVAATAALGGVGLLLPVVHRQVARR